MMIRIVLLAITLCAFAHTVEARSLDRDVTYHFENEAGVDLPAPERAVYNEQAAVEHARKTNGIVVVKRCIDFGPLLVHTCRIIWTR